MLRLRTQRMEKLECWRWPAVGDVRSQGPSRRHALLSDLLLTLPLA